MYGLLMALAMLFMAGLCACSAQPHSVAETAPQTIVVGIDVFDPYSYLDRNGQFAGIDVELATEAFSRLGYTPEFRTISWPDKDNLLSDGTIDCIWSCFSMNGRETKYQWAGPYMYSRQVVAVRADSDIQSLSDLPVSASAYRQPQRRSRCFSAKFPLCCPKSSKSTALRRQRICLRHCAKAM